MSSHSCCMLHSPRDTAELWQEHATQRSAPCVDWRIGPWHFPGIASQLQPRSTMLSHLLARFGGCIELQRGASGAIPAALALAIVGIAVAVLVGALQTCLQHGWSAGRRDPWHLCPGTVSAYAYRDVSHALLTLRHFLSWPGMPRHLMQRLPSGLHFWQPDTASVQRTH